MTVFFDFAPALNSNFQFSATFDGNEYTVVCTFNTFSQRYYVNIYDTFGTLTVSQPMSGSPPGSDLSLTAGYFTTKLVWRATDGRFEVI